MLAVANPGFALQPGSCFESAGEAASFLKYTPTSMSVHGRKARLAEVRRDESKWSETELHVEEADWTYMKELGQRHLGLERATRVAPIDYEWHIGRTLPLASLHAAVALALLSRGQVDTPLRALELAVAALGALVLSRGARVRYATTARQSERPPPM